jgi:hypothetical protein
MMLRTVDGRQQSEWGRECCMSTRNGVFEGPLLWHRICSFTMENSRGRIRMSCFFLSVGRPCVSGRAIAPNLCLFVQLVTPLQNVDLEHGERRRPANDMRRPTFCNKRHKMVWHWPVRCITLHASHTSCEQKRRDARAHWSYDKVQ